MNEEMKLTNPPEEPEEEYEEEYTFKGERECEMDCEEIPSEEELMAALMT